MKKLWYSFFVFFVVMQVASGSHRPRGGHRGLFDDRDDGPSIWASDFYAESYSQSRELQECSRYRNLLQQTVTKLEDAIQTERLKSKKNPDDRIRILEERLTRDKRELEEANRKLEIVSGQQKPNGVVPAAVFGVSRALLGRGASVSDSLGETVVQAVTYNMFKPMGKVVSQRSESLWEKVIDKAEGAVSAVLRFFGLTSTISGHDIMRWQASCVALAETYKDLRKGIESSESRSTSLQLRSFMGNDDDEAEEIAESEIEVVDKSWEQKRRGDLIFLTAMHDKLERMLATCGHDSFDERAALERLLCEVEGLGEQILSARSLRDLVDGNRANLMISYFASIDAALIELGMLIAAPEFDEIKSRRRKTTSHGYSGYGGYSDY